MNILSQVLREIGRQLRPLRDLPRYRIASFDPAWLLEADGANAAGGSPVVLVTGGFGAPRYAQAARRLATQARSTGFFSSVFAFSDLAEVPGMDAAVVTPYERLARDFPRGYGLWAWKPALVAAVMRTLPDDSLVFYVDAGCEISAWGQNRFGAYLTMLRREGHLFFRIPFEEREWTAACVLDRFGLPRDDQSDQVQATWFGVVNTASGRALIKEWADECISDDARLLRPSGGSDDGLVVSHREDQSVLSCLLKRRGVACLPWEDQFVPELYRANSWILLMPVHTLRLIETDSRIDALLARSSREACLADARNAGYGRPGWQVRLRAAARSLRETAFYLREAMRGVRRLLALRAVG